MKEGLVSYIINLFKVLFTKGLVIIIGFLNSVIIARCLGVEGQGQYALAMTIYSIGFQFINMGLHSANTYYLAKDKNTLPLVWGNSIGITFVSFVICVIGVLIFPNLKIGVGLPYEVASIVFFLIPCYLYYYLQYQTLLVLDKILVLNVLDIVVVLLPFIANIILFVFQKATINIVLGMMLGTYIIVDLFGFIYFIYLKIELRPSLKFYRKCMKLGIVASIACFVGYLVLRVDILMIQRLLGVQETGIYSLAANLVEIVNTFGATCTLVMFPKVTAIEDKEERYKYTIQIFKIISLCMVVLLVVGEILGKYLIPLVYGKEFFATVNVFRILLVGIVFWGLAGIPISYYTSEKKYGISFVSYSVAFVLNIALNSLWIPKYGVIGAAFASDISYFIVLLFTGIYFIKRK